MRKNISILILVAFAIIFSMPILTIAVTDEEKAEATKKALMEKYEYTTENRDFESKIKVGSQIIALAPGEGAEIPGDIIPEGEIPTWADVAQYERIFARSPDPVARWFVENLWRNRINRVLDMLEQELKEKYPKEYKRINIRIGDAIAALWLEDIGPFTGEVYAKIPDGFGGRLPILEPALIEKYIDINQYVQDFLDDIAPETKSQTASPYS